MLVVICLLVIVGMDLLLLTVFSRFTIQGRLAGSVSLYDTDRKYSISLLESSRMSLFVRRNMLALSDWLNMCYIKFILIDFLM